jgi:uncharacterized protein (DUF1330 family)
MVAGPVGVTVERERPSVPVTLCVLLTPTPGGEARLVEYEDRVLALLPAHGGRVLSRVRRTGDGAGPYEVHVLDLPSEAALEAYLEDPARLALAGLRDLAIAHTELLRVEVVAADPQG